MSLIPYHKLGLYTSNFWHSLETATATANRWTKEEGVYHTAIKGEQTQYPSLASSAECWAITNRYDTKVIAYTKENHDGNQTVS